MPEPEEMICPLCRTVLGAEDHCYAKKERVDGRRLDANWYHCPECSWIVYDWDDEYVRLPDENYPPF